jgi:hypothetical protein
MRSQLMRKLLSRFQCLSAVSFGNTGCSMKQLQDCLPCFVELISGNGFRICRKRDHGLRFVAASVHLSAHCWTLPVVRPRIGAASVHICDGEQPVIALFNYIGAFCGTVAPKQHLSFWATG